jgi:hypothetical protein
MNNQIINSKFYKDLTNEEAVTSVNGNPLPIAMWNLAITIRDVSLFSKGIKPHRFWKLKDVKAYFGVTGSTENVLFQLKQLQEQITKN